LLCQDISSSVGDILTNFGECRQSKNDPVTNYLFIYIILQVAPPPGPTRCGGITRWKTSIQPHRLQTGSGNDSGSGIQGLIITLILNARLISIRNLSRPREH